MHVNFLFARCIDVNSYDNTKRYKSDHILYTKAHFKDAKESKMSQICHKRRIYRDQGFKIAKAPNLVKNLIYDRLL
ncbi:MAG: hypothetical protein OXC46_05370 [Thaumarchaeota archaeon]|nr:hypothetical protein [Nitrososphaerota archaeon]